MIKNKNRKPFFSDGRLIRVFLPVLGFLIIPSLTGLFVVGLIKSLVVYGNLEPGIIGLLFVLISTACMSLAIVPTTMIAILGGYLFGWNYFPFIVLSYLLASILALHINDVLIKKVIKTDLSKVEQSQRLIVRMRGDEFKLIVLMRLSPILPFAVNNYLLANIKPSTGKYLTATLIGMLPRTAISYYTGMQATDIWQYVQRPTATGIIKFIPLILLLISTLGLGLLIKKFLKPNPFQNGNI